MRRVARLVATLAVVGGIGTFGSTEAALASTTPSISTSQQPSSAVLGSSIADKATVSGASAYVCPPQDNAGFPVGSPPNYQSDSGGVWFCSYPAFTNENPNDFYCTYSDSGGALITDHDAGFCPATATTTGAPGATPTGTVTFDLYNNSSASGTPLFSDTETLSGGSATSASYTTASTGTDYWVATYNGDTNYNSVASSNNGEPVTVTGVTPSIATSQQPASAVVGNTIADQATVTGSAGAYSCPPQDNAGFSVGSPPSYQSDSGGVWFCSYPAFPGETATDFYCTYSDSSGALITDNDAGFCPATARSGTNSPTGTVTFNLYDNATASGTPLFTDTESLSGGSATSAGFTATATGTDYWVATYNGDSDFSSVTSGDAAEPVAIKAATASIGTSQQPASTTVGGSIADQATVSGGDSPTGTVTFDLYEQHLLGHAAVQRHREPVGWQCDQRWLHDRGYRHRLLGGYL